MHELHIYADLLDEQEAAQPEETDSEVDFTVDFTVDFIVDFEV